MVTGQGAQQAQHWNSTSDPHHWGRGSAWPWGLCRRWAVWLGSRENNQGSIFQEMSTIVRSSKASSAVVRGQQKWSARGRQLCTAHPK